MRNAFVSILIGIGALGMLGCEEEVKPAKVHGEMSYNGVQCGAEFETISGSLAKGGAKYYGYCKKKKDDSFDFVVATADMANATNSTDFYLQVRGIVGPPVEGVYDANVQPKDDPNLYTTFESAVLKNVNDFTFEYGDSNDLENPELCDITLYAKPIEGELNPNKEKFKWFVEMVCGGLDVPANTDDTIILNHLAFKFWFSGC
jgi:hypothetical protein